MKKKLFGALILLTSIALLSPAGVAYADTGVGGGSGGGGGGSSKADNGGDWKIMGPSGNCKTNKLEKYFKNGQKWSGGSWSYNSPMTNSGRVNNSIGPVHYTFNGQNYSSGNASVTYAWLITKEQGAWSWRSKAQIGAATGHIWIDSMSGKGKGAGQLLWACASGSQIKTTTVVNDELNTKTCVVAVETQIGNAAPNYALNNTAASNSSIYNNCITDYDLNVASPQLNQDHNIQARQITKDITETSVTTTITLYGAVIATNTTTNYTSTAPVAQPWVSKIVEATRVSLTPSDLGYWFVDNREPGGGHWVDSSGNPIDESNPKKHSVKLAIGELWDNNKPVRADWTSLSDENRTFKECTSTITVPGKDPVLDPADLECEMSAVPMTLSSQKIANGRSIHLLSFAPVNNQSAEELTWSVTTSAGPEDVVESRVIRSISSDSLGVDLSTTVDMAQPYNYGGYVSFNFSTNNGITSIADDPVYNTPYSGIIRQSVFTRIMGGNIWTYTANNDVN